jgi:electron transport complex protein RnfB
MSLIDRIDAILPQTQCRKCTFAACRPYAEAIASGEANINQCPPGGQKGIDALAALLDVKSTPLNPEYGEKKPLRVAFIIEEDCIGCVKCIQACPVDAIVGAAKQMHTIIAAECTGCELCIAPCPVDCIALQPTSNDNQYQPEKAKMRYEAKVHRQVQEIEQKAERDKRRKAKLAKLMATKK